MLKETGIMSETIKHENENEIDTEKVAMIQSTNKDIAWDIVRQIDHVRKQKGLSRTKFCEDLFDVNSSMASKIFSGTRNLTLDMLLTFCRYYGYDLTELVDKAFIEKIDHTILEVAVFMTTLSDETLDKIEDYIVNESNEKDGVKKRAEH